MLHSPSFPNHSDPGQISIATFNTLADQFVYYHRKYCPQSALCFDYRKQLFHTILSSFNTDFICLQEIDHFSDFFEPLLQSLGYNSYYLRRPDFRRDGSVIAWRAKKYTLLEKVDIHFDSHEKCAENTNYIRNNIGIAAVFESKVHEKPIIVATAHFFWDTTFELIQFLQATMFLQALGTLKAKYNCPVITTGDYNCTPDSKPLRYLLNQEISLQDTELESLFLNQPFKLSSAYENYSSLGYPRYTHYFPKKKVCIDYILYSTELQVSFLASLPEDATIESRPGLFSNDFPSDHLPLLAAFSLN
jgi:mRNA deadenylase 3'-5' endonuclease subunit Ccr4